MNKFYAGIGSRKTPEKYLEIIRFIAGKLEKDGYILRSGGAQGADKAFEQGVKELKNQIIFQPKENLPEWTNVWKEFIPKDLENVSFLPYTKQLMQRNMMILLGEDGKSPVEFVICWTKPNIKYEDSRIGGTGYALRAALKYNIPIFNLNKKAEIQKLIERMSWIKK